MMTINNNDVLPEIFFATHKYYQNILEQLKNVNYEQFNTQDFLANYAIYMSNGYAYFKGALGDLCVGVKALGDKLGALGGQSFANLKQQSDTLVSATGNLFNYVSNFVPTQSDEKILIQNVQEYLETLVECLKQISNSTTHLYGDAKNRLGDKFEAMSNSMVSFIRMAKIKVVSAIAVLQVATAYAQQTFAKNAEAPANEINLANEDATLNKSVCQQLVDKIIVDFDDAKAQAQKWFN